MPAGLQLHKISSERWFVLSVTYHTENNFLQTHGETYAIGAFFAASANTHVYVLMVNVTTQLSSISRLPELYPALDSLLSSR